MPTAKNKSKKRKPNQVPPADSGKSMKVYDHRSNGAPVETIHGEKGHPVNYKDSD